MRMIRLLASLALLLTAAVVAAQVKPLNSRLPPDLPAEWTAAPAIPLWPAGALPAITPKATIHADNWPTSFIQNVASPYLKLFRPAKPNGRALLIIPGGAYIFVSVANEGVDVARRFADMGYMAYVLVYRLPGEGWPDRADVPLMDAQRAMRVIRGRARTDGIDPAHVAAVGFSAGGHLAASLATDFAAPLYKPVDGADRLSARPDAAGLIYGVMTLDTRTTNSASRASLLGAAPDEALVERRSPVLHVGPTTPPAFLLHAIDDRTVPVENSLMMLAAMRAARRPVEAHLLAEGGHGFGTGFSGTPSALWPDLFDAWLRRLP